MRAGFGRSGCVALPFVTDGIAGGLAVMALANATERCCFDIRVA